MAKYSFYKHTVQHQIKLFSPPITTKSSLSLLTKEKNYSDILCAIAPKSAIPRFLQYAPTRTTWRLKNVYEVDHVFLLSYPNSSPSFHLSSIINAHVKEAEFSFFLLQSTFQIPDSLSVAPLHHFSWTGDFCHPSVVILVTLSVIFLEDGTWIGWTHFAWVLIAVQLPSKLHWESFIFWSCALS